jgi:hypothetical protein
VGALLDENSIFGGRRHGAGSDSGEGQCGSSDEQACCDHDGGAEPGVERGRIGVVAAGYPGQPGYNGHSE